MGKSDISFESGKQNSCWREYMAWYIYPLTLIWGFVFCFVIESILHSQRIPRLWAREPCTQFWMLLSWSASLLSWLFSWWLYINTGAIRWAWETELCFPSYSFYDWVFYLCFTWSSKEKGLSPGWYGLVVGTTARQGSEVRFLVMDINMVAGSFQPRSGARAGGNQYVWVYIQKNCQYPKKVSAYLWSLQHYS